MFSYAMIEKLIKHNVRGGEGEIHSRDYIKSGMTDLPFEAFGLNEMQPGATIPEHCHADSAEFYYIVSGHGTGLHNGQRFAVGPGDGWLCRAGETHGILNTVVPGQVLSFVSVYFAKPAG
ncbi:MAG TPA: cupin domain-containing protein [Candidatus Rifleibacterium sp.]|nr:cupin domain-containing protein [Candidatus Rifleibacterium sp.]HPT47603.1 cupin domain-containing protein [Candidatus Rifleibacterium sp.]